MANEFEEKRRYFRVNDSISLLHKVVDEHIVDRLSHVSNEVLKNTSLIAALDMLTQDNRALLARLERRDPELSEYLKIIDTKINLMAQAISLHTEEYCEHDILDVSLSATGLAFGNQTPISVGTFLELRILLTSCMAVIVAYAKVVHCRENSDPNTSQPFTICVEYINLKEDDQELLIKHVVKTQLQQLRDKTAH